MENVIGNSCDDGHLPKYIGAEVKTAFSRLTRVPFWGSLKARLSRDTPQCSGVQEVSTVVPTGNWDSSDSGADWEQADNPLYEHVPEDFSVDSQLGVSANIQLYWYEWMLYELEDCVYDAVSKHPSIFRDAFTGGALPRGALGPIDILQRLENCARNENFPRNAFAGGYRDFAETTALAMEFRHLAEHRARPMEVANLFAAVRLPGRLLDDARARKFEQVLEVLKAGLPSASDDTAETAEVRAMIFSRHVFADPQLDLLSIIVDDLKKSSFDCAKRLHPEDFPPTAIYKAYEPKHWDRMWPTHHAQDEATKIAFPDPDGELLKHAFGDATDIRNNFTHRNRRYQMSRSARFEFWYYMRAAVRLALLLGDRALAFKFDLLVRLHTSPGLTRSEAEAQFQADGIEAAVDQLLQPSTRQAAIETWYSCDPSSASASSTVTMALRERWVVVDVLMRGEEEFRGLEPPVLGSLAEQEEEISGLELWDLYGESDKFGSTTPRRTRPRIQSGLGEA